MSKVDIKFNNQIMDRENIEKLANAINENADATLDENGKIDTSKLNKKLYYHPITMYASGKGVISLLIIDNDDTAFTKERLTSALNSFPRVSPITGSWKFGDNTLLCSYAFKNANNDIRLLGVYLDGTIQGGQEGVTLGQIITEATGFSDGVNQIL